MLLSASGVLDFFAVNITVEDQMGMLMHDEIWKKVSVSLEKVGWWEGDFKVLESFRPEKCDHMFSWGHRGKLKKKEVIIYLICSKRELGYKCCDLCLTSYVRIDACDYLWDLTL